MKKKALATRTLVEIIFFVVLFLVGLAIASKLINFFVEKPKTGTLKSLDTLKIEIDNIDKQIEVPVYVDASHIIKGIIDGENVPGCEKDKSCLCVCINKKGCSGEGINKCTPLESTLKNEFIIQPKFVEEKAKLVEKEAKIQNCILAEEEKKVVVSGCA